MLDSPEKLKSDPEIQAWAQELATPRENGGVGIQVFHINYHMFNCLYIVNNLPIASELEELQLQPSMALQIWI